MLARWFAALRRLFRLFGFGDSAAPATQAGAPPPRLGDPELGRPGPTPPPPPPSPPVEGVLALHQFIATGGEFPLRSGGSGPSGFTLGMIHSIAGSSAAFGAPPADGRLLPVPTNQPLMAVIGLNYGGDGMHLGLPNLKGRTPIGGAQLGLMQPQVLELSYLIATQPVSGAPVLGMVIAFAGNYPPQGWAFADGTMQPISANVPLYQAIGQTFGGNPVAFALPNLNGFAVIGAGQGPGTPTVALGGRVPQPVPALGLNYLINVSAAPATGGNGGFPQFQSYLGQVIAYAGAEPPAGWMLCDGSLLAPGDYAALFQQIGTSYGGDGQTSFALPDLRGRVMTGS